MKERQERSLPWAPIRRDSGVVAIVVKAWHSDSEDPVSNSLGQFTPDHWWLWREGAELRGVIESLVCWQEEFWELWSQEGMFSSSSTMFAPAATNSAVSLLWEVQTTDTPVLFFSPNTVTYSSW